MKRLFSLLLVVCLLCGGLTGCGDDGSGKGFRFPLSAEPAQLDPQVCTDTASITLLSVLFEGLTRLDDTTGAPIPGAADWTVSPDGLTYTFTLRESYWSTLSLRGEETPWDQPTRVVADDFVFGLERARQEGTLSLSGATIKATNDRVVTITLAKPDDRLLTTLATTPCMPCNRAFFAYTAGRYGLEKEYLLSNGPFRLTAWNHQESLLLYKNEAYHAADEIAPEAVRFVINPAEAAAQLSAGTLDVAALQPDQLAAAKKEGCGIVDLADTVRSLWFRTSSGPLAVPAIRQALRDSIQWDTVYEHLQQAGEIPAVGFVPPSAVVSGNEIYRRADNARPFTADVAAARVALKTGLAQLYPEQKNPTLPTIKVATADDEVSANLARYILQSWQKNLDISVTLVTLPAAKLSGGIPAEADVAIATHTPTGLTGAENLSLFATGGVGNRSGFSDKQTDAAIAAALAGGRAELDALEKRLWSMCPCLPLSYPYRYYGIADGVQGISIRPFGGGVYGSPFGIRQAKKWD